MKIPYKTVMLLIALFGLFLTCDYVYASYAEFALRATACKDLQTGKRLYDFTKADIKPDSQKNFVFVITPDDADLNQMRKPFEAYDCSMSETKNLHNFNALVNTGFIPGYYANDNPRGKDKMRGSFEIFKWDNRIFFSFSYRGAFLTLDVVDIQIQNKKFILYTEFKPYKLKKTAFISLEVVEAGMNGKVNVDFPSPKIFTQLRFGKLIGEANAVNIAYNLHGVFERSVRAPHSGYFATWNNEKYMVETKQDVKYYPENHKKTTGTLRAGEKARLLALGFDYLDKEIDWKKFETTQCWVIELPDGKLALIRYSDFPVQIPLFPEVHGSSDFKAQFDLSIEYRPSVRILVLRTEPSRTSKAIGNISHNDTLMIESFTDVSDVIEGRRGYWAKVKTSDGREGYVFAGFLEEAGR